MTRREKVRRESVDMQYGLLWNESRVKVMEKKVKVKYEKDKHEIGGK